MFEQPSPDELDALIGARLGGAPLPAGVAESLDGVFALALLDAAEQTHLDATFANALDERLRAAWRPQPNSRRPRILAPLASRPRAIAAAILLIITLLGALLAVPQTRAAIAALLHIGSVTIVPTRPPLEPTSRRHCPPSWIWQGGQRSPTRNSACHSTFACPPIPPIWARRSMSSRRTSAARRSCWSGLNRERPTACA